MQINKDFNTNGHLLRDHENTFPHYATEFLPCLCLVKYLIIPTLPNLWPSLSKFNLVRYYSNTPISDDFTNGTEPRSYTGRRSTRESFFSIKTVFL